MNDVLKVIQSRFSCRGYDGRPVPRDVLDAISLAALQAPSAMNLQPWQVIVIDSKDMVDELDAAAMEILAANEDKSAYNRMMDRGGKIFYGAPCLYLVLRDPTAKWGEVDCGILTQNICLAASSQGIDNVIVAMAAIPFNGPRGDEFKARIGWPPGWDFGMGVLVGYGNVSKDPHEVDNTKLRHAEL